ncbi:hypothetical protein QWJ39_08435 [Arthrobacter sp. YD4]|uniref:hypothetical protein n=1 Tax=Arthrobacter sp. YD4 TaxID=3058043 RepID=UPI0025B62082|nr:hypothetical protein [Arthrobacter sp. YD4]MDN3936340.1 hypothetical protein [Arthrobacter sp. YD4]
MPPSSPEPPGVPDPVPPGVPDLGRPDVPDPDTAGTNPEQGSAVVEFTFLALLLMVPVVYFIITLGQLQGGSFAVAGAADQAAKVFVAQADAGAGRAAAEQAVQLALADYGQPAGNATLETACSSPDCTAAGSAVTVTVRLTVPLPFVPFGEALRLDAGHLSATSTQIVGRFR